MLTITGVNISHDQQIARGAEIRESKITVTVDGPRSTAQDLGEAIHKLAREFETRHKG